RVADADILERADRGDDVGRLAGADLAAGEAIRLGIHLADVRDLERAADAHHADLVANFETAVEDAGAKLRSDRLSRRGKLLADGREEFGDADAGLGGDEQAVLGREAQRL